MPKRYYNSDYKENAIMSGTTSFDFSVPLYDTFFLDMIGKEDTYRCEVDLDNSDEFSTIRLILCNCTFDQSINSGENALIKYKIQSNGTILGETPSMSSFFSSNSVQLIFTNTTKNLIYEVPFLESITPKFDPKYIDKPIFRQKPKKILQLLGLNCDCVGTLLSDVLRTWIGDDLTASVNLYSLENSIPLTITNVTIDSLTYSPEKDSAIKKNFSFSGYL